MCTTIFVDVSQYGVNRLESLKSEGFQKDVTSLSPSEHFIISAANMSIERPKPNNTDEIGDHATDIQRYEVELSNMLTFWSVCLDANNKEYLISNISILPASSIVQMLEFIFHEVSSWMQTTQQSNMQERTWKLILSLCAMSFGPLPSWKDELNSTSGTFISSLWIPIDKSFHFFNFE
jgi:hypothetical protein